MGRPDRVRFTEEMRGAVGFGAATHREGWDEGVAATCPLMFHLTISVTDLDRFAADPDHTAPAIGWVRCPALSDTDMRVERGTFNLFAPGQVADRTTMRYRLWFRDCAGEPLTLSGFKDVGDDAGLDMWKDTTSLFTNLLDGHVPEPARRPDGRFVPDDPAAGPGPRHPRHPDPGLRPPAHHVPRHTQGRRPASPACSRPPLWRTYRGRVRPTGARDGRPRRPRPAERRRHGVDRPRPTTPVPRAASGRCASCATSRSTRSVRSGGSIRGCSSRPGLQLVLSGVFERFADKREYMGGIVAPDIAAPGTDTDDVWIDYVSDVGDGFDATATVAWMLAQDQLVVDDEGAAAARLGARPRR